MDTHKDEHGWMNMDGSLTMVNLGKWAMDELLIIDKSS
jgi:hypothetical protein